MHISRRGFLGTMATALVGLTATFDPQRALWIPPSVRDTVVIDGLDELNDLALRFAKQMAERLSGHRATVLRQVTFAHAAHATTIPVLRLDESTGYFQPERRVVKTGQVWRESDAFIASMAGQTMRELERLGRVNMFAPMSPDLRAGMPFSDCLATVVADPESGLSARALRFTNDEHKVLTSLELAPGVYRLAGRLVMAPQYSDEEESF